MSNLENIGYNLVLDDSGFRVTAQSTASQLKALEAQFASTGQGVKAIEAKINSAGVAFHQWVTTIGAVKFALMDIDSVFLTLPKSIMETAGEMEKLTTVLKGLSTAATEAGRAADAALGKNFIINLEQNAPFKLAALTDTFVKFKTVGIDPTKGAMEELVNQVAKYGGGSEQLKSAALAIQQMAGKGTVSLQELRLQLSQAVPNAAQAMATGMGMSMAQLTQAITKGAVGSDMAIRKMLAVFANDSMGSAMEQMKTWQGTLEKLNVRWDLFKVDVADAGMFQAAKDELNDIMKLFGTPQAHEWAQSLSDSFVGLIGLFHDGRASIQEYLPELVQLGKVLLAVFSANMLANFITGMRNTLVGINDSYREYAANAIAADGAVVEKRLSITEQILAADAKRRESIAMESEARQEALSREIANNQKQIVANDARYAAIDSARQAEYAKEIANNEAVLAQKLALFEELTAAERTYSATLLAEQYKRAQMGMASNTATAAQYVSQARFTEELERGLVSMQAEIALLEKESVALMERTNLLRGVTAAEIEATAAQGALNTATSAQNAALVEKNAALATAIGAERTAIANMTAMSTGAAVLESGLMKLKFAFNALGGWIGLVSAAVIGGIALWDRYKEHAEQAARAAIIAATIDKSVAQNKVTKGQIDDATSGIKDKQSQIDMLKSQIDMRKAGVADDGTTFIGRKGEDDPEVKAMRAKIVALQKDTDALIAVRKKGQDSYDQAQAKLEAHSYAQGLEDATNQQLSSLSASRAQRIADIQTYYKDKLSSLKMGSDAEKALSQKQADELKAVEVDITGQRVKVLQQRRDAINAQIKQGFTGKDAQAQAFAAAQEQDRLNQQIATAQGNQSDLAAPNPIGEKAKKGGKIGPPTDLLAKALGHTQAQIDEAKGQLRAIVTGATEYDQLRLDAQAKVYDLLTNGQLDFKTKGKDGKSTTPSKDDPRVQQLIDNETMLTIVANAKSQMEQLKGKLAPLAAEYKEGMAKLMAGDVTTPDGDKDSAAIKFLEKLSTKSLQAANDLAPVIENMKRIKLASDQIDLMNFTREIVKADQQARVELIDNQQDRLNAQIQLENDAWVKIANDRLEKVRKLGGDVANEEELIAQAAVTRDVANARKRETPMQEMVRKWGDTTNQLRQKTTSWADSTIDAFVNVAKTGKLSFGDLLETIGTDILRISLQKSMGGGLQSLYDGIADKAAGAIGGASKGSATDAATQGAAAGLPAFIKGPLDKVGEMFNSLFGTGERYSTTLEDNVKNLIVGQTTQQTTQNSLITLGNAAQYAAVALSQIQSSSGSGGGIGGALGSIAGALASAYFGGSASGTAGGLAQTAPMSSSSTLMGIQGGTNTLGNWNYTGGQMSNQYKFADGGIMTQLGPMALRKYANGGIANSPQVAIYGEGSMNEAFVPLPDGKSIPVTLTGGQQSAGAAAANVVVNVINQSGQAVQGQQAGSPRFDGKQMVLDIVLTAATQPGNFRDGLKGALK